MTKIEGLDAAIQLIREMRQEMQLEPIEKQLLTMVIGVLLKETWKEQDA